MPTEQDTHRPGAVEPARQRELLIEQLYVDALYTRLDVLRAATAVTLDGVRRSSTSGTPAALMERDAFDALHSERLMQLRAVEERLCFGRLDLRDGHRRYVGRLGLADTDRHQLLIDWRAPAAEPFYQATAASPDGVVRRRHIATRGREVTGLEDEVLDLEALTEDQGATVSGEGALFVALGAARTGRMRDIVATIQAEQDRVIRAPMAGVLVVQGGPGTGKTAVALHRAAFLLHAHRARIARSGVLVVGPNRVFLRYIEQVLPSLGESGVVMVTPGQLLPGVSATGSEAPAVAALKGDLRLADVIEAAVRLRPRVPAGNRRLRVEGAVLTLRRRDVEGAQARARGSRKPYNAARVVFVKDLLGRLSRQLATAQRVELTEDSRPELLATLRESRDVRREVNLAWMPQTPQQLLADLWADPARLAAAASRLTDVERRLLHRERGGAWTPADVPLLDEAAELLGEDDSAARTAAQREDAERRGELEHARAVLAGSAAGGMITADALVDRFAETRSAGSVVDRASGDREWAFGHVVVDEAQELSPMAWRVLMRRCPSRSMTVVGDVAQTSALAGAASWAQVLDPHVAGRWRQEELTVNYRTPRAIMAVAADLLVAAGRSVRAPESARETDEPPTAQRIAAGDTAALAAAVRAELAVLDGGRLAVLTPRAGHGTTRAALVAELPTDTVATEDAPLDRPVSVLTVMEAKGLEFDAVLLLEPAAILAESARGVGDLYVALTRPTQRLRVLHSDDLPPGLHGLTRVDR